MSESNTAYDLRILAEMADEIIKYDVVGLPASLRSFLQTERAKKVGTLLESLALRLCSEKYMHELDFNRLTKENSDLRDTIQQLTDDLLKRIDGC